MYLLEHRGDNIGHVIFEGTVEECNDLVDYRIYRQKQERDLLHSHAWKLHDDDGQPFTYSVVLDIPEE